MNKVGIDTNTFKTLQTISSLEFVKQYYLAGGTACALHLGHRLSYDLDFFSLNPASPTDIRNALINKGELEIYQNEQGTFNGSLNGTKLSFFVYPYQNLRSPHLFENIAVADLADLVCMKLEAVASRGVKRDFIDLFFILKQIKLKQAIEYFEKKYTQQNISVAHVLKSLTYFSDADEEPMPNMIRALNWIELKKFFQKEVQVWSKRWL